MKKNDSILRAKTMDLLQINTLTEKQSANSNLNIKELKSGLCILQSFPRRIVLELSNACNLKCIMCARVETAFDNTFFNISNLKKLDSVLERAEEITLFGWGEPTIHPKFLDILECVNRFPIRKYFVTNGMKLRNLREAIFNYKIHIMSVSLDGASAVTNNRIRVGSDFNQIVNELSNIVEEKQKRKCVLPYINLVFTAMRSNLHELKGMVKLAHEIGLEEVKVVYLTVFGKNLLTESLWNRFNDVKLVFDEATQLAESLGVKIKLPYIQGEDLAGQQYHRNCYVAWRDIFIGSDGYIRPCQSTARKLFCINDYSKFEDMWNSLEYQTFRQSVNNIDMMPLECKNCYQSSHANWNRRQSFIQVDQIFAPKWGKQHYD